MGVLVAVDVGLGGHGLTYPVAFETVLTAEVAGSIFLFAFGALQCASLVVAIAA
jgi:hypothetical protein